MERGAAKHIDLLGLVKALGGEAETSGVPCNRHVLRKDDNDDVLRRALDFEVVERRGRGRPKITGRREVEEYI